MKLTLPSLCWLWSCTLVCVLTTCTAEPLHRTLDYHINFTSEKYTPKTINYTTAIDPALSWGKWEGWGVSLCWWAHVLGQSDELADLVFSRKSVELEGRQLPGLGMNVARYNLGASGWRTIDGQRMEASPNIVGFKQIEGFWQDWYSEDPQSASWNWTVDANRFAMLKKAHERGADHLELFSNSPMWWMLVNHNPSGSFTGLFNNLEAWNFQTFAKYLATTAAHFKDVRGIEFTSVEPFNEPASLYWRSYGTQEGCHFTRSLQAYIIGLLHDELQARPGLAELKIASSDEWKYDMAIDTWRSFDNETRSRVGKVNVHGYQYSGGRRNELFEAVAGKTLWMSEYGDGSGSGLEMASNLNLDFRWLHPTAWCYWQIVDESDGWGLLQADLGGENHAIKRVNTKYFVLAHYTRHIRPGMTIIDGGEGNTVAAYDAKARRLVIVTVNYGNAQWITYDLSAFGAAKGPVTRWCTNADGGGEEYVEHRDVQVSGNELMAHFAPNTIQTFEVENVDLAANIYV